MVATVPQWRIHLIPFYGDWAEQSKVKRSIMEWCSKWSEDFWRINKCETLMGDWGYDIVAITDSGMGLQFFLSFGSELYLDYKTREFHVYYLRPG